ncbi:hypothetical protein FS749_013519, partial [Ceratobasidium sp. UAMH 11750]
MSYYTSGFISIENTVETLCQELKLDYGPTIELAYPLPKRSVGTCRASTIARSGIPCSLFRFKQIHAPKGVWMLPTALSKSPINVNPETHENTILVKEAVMVTGIAQEHLETFRTYPNTKRPNT